MVDDDEGAGSEDEIDSGSGSDVAGDSSNGDMSVDGSFSDPSSIDDDDDIEDEMCDELQNDVNQYVEMFGVDRIATKFSPARNTHDISFFFEPMDYITQTTADAWDVYPDFPIACCLRISGSKYRSVGAPRVEIWQTGAPTSVDETNADIKAEEVIKEKGLLKESELKALHYPNGVPASELAVLADMVAKAVPGYTPGPVIPPKAKPFNPGRFGLQVQMTTILNSFVSKYWSHGSKLTESVETAVPDEAEIQTLMTMGYPREQAGRAWRASKAANNGKGSIEHAVTLLADPDFGKNSLKNSNPSQQQAKKRKKNIKAQLNWNHGFFVAFGTYFAQRFATVNNYCVICDMPHIGIGASLLKPCVCTRDLCCWSFQQLGVGADASSEIATPVDVTDLLVSMIIAAAKSNRKDRILDPFPTLFDPVSPSKPVLSPENKNWDLLNQIVAAICSVDSKLSGAWRNGLQKAHPMAWPLLNWITSSNRSHLVRLPPTYHIPSMVTPYQYLLISAPPEKEAEFQKAKKQYGSLWAFHGSAPENWHSILRRGLLNASGTALQVNGAAYGAGIYLSPAASVSFGYSRLGYGTTSATNYQDPVTGLPDPLNPRDINSSIALCEVVDHQIRKSGDIWVQPEPSYVVTRIFFVYPPGQATGSAANLRCDATKFISEITASAQFYCQNTTNLEELDDSEDEF